MAAASDESILYDPEQDITVLKKQLLKYYKTFSVEIDNPFGTAENEAVNIEDIMRVKSIGPEIYNAIVTKKIEALRYMMDYGFMIFCKSLDKTCPIKTFPASEARLNALSMGLLPIMLEMDEKTRDICKSILTKSREFIKDKKLSDMRLDPPYMMRCDLSAYDVYLQLLEYRGAMREFYSNIFLIANLMARGRNGGVGDGVNGGGDGGPPTTDHPKP